MERAVKIFGRRQFLLREDGQLLAGPIIARTMVITDRPLRYVILVDPKARTSTSLTLCARAWNSFLKEMGFRYPGANHLLHL
jgi:hypothetical protein